MTYTSAPSNSCKSLESASTKSPDQIPSAHRTYPINILFQRLLSELMVVGHVIGGDGRYSADAPNGMMGLSDTFPKRLSNAV